MGEKGGGKVEWWVEGESVKVWGWEEGEEMRVGYGKGVRWVERDRRKRGKLYRGVLGVGWRGKMDGEK